MNGGKIMGSAAAYDLEHNGMRIEAKLATRSHQSKGAQFRYQWNSLRQGDEWTHAWLIAVSFESVRAFLVPRAEVDLHEAKDSFQAYWVGPSATHDATIPVKWLVDREVQLVDAKGDLTSGS